MDCSTMIAAPVPAHSNGLIARLGDAGPTLALALAASAAVLAAAHLIQRGSLPERLFSAVLPLSPLAPSAFGAVLSAVTLVALAVGLRRGKRRSWELAVIVFGAAAFVQGVLLHHPIAGIAGACLVVLLAGRERYAIRIGRPGDRIVALTVVAVLAAVGDMALALTFPAARTNAATGLSAATGTLADVFSFSSVRPFAGLAGNDGLLAAHRGAKVHYLVGRRGSREMPGDPLDVAGPRALVPDVRDRDVYLCGPFRLMESVRASLKALAVSASQVHLERFAY
jgi:hypothetical protein